MKGIEGAKKYFELYGNVIKEQFPDFMKYAAFGICGQGSECLGFDDEISRDHDFEPGFCLFLPDENKVDRRTAFLMERAYAKLPKEFDGAKRSLVSPVGGSRRGVMRTADFFEKTVGKGNGVLSKYEWLNIPESCLLEAVNGEIFEDNYGEITEIRRRLSFYPDDIARKKLASALIICGQAGQYNFPRCISHGERAAAQLAVFEFVNAALRVIFLLNKKYRPFYKWSFRALSGLPQFSELYDSLEFLITGENDDKTARLKSEIIEDICRVFLQELMLWGFAEKEHKNAEDAAYDVNSQISDSDIRNMSIFA